MSHHRLQRGETVVIMNCKQCSSCLWKRGQESKSGINKGNIFSYQSVMEMLVFPQREQVPLHNLNIPKEQRHGHQYSHISSSLFSDYTHRRIQLSQ